MLISVVENDVYDGCINLTKKDFEDTDTDNVIELGLLIAKIDVYTHELQSSGCSQVAVSDKEQPAVGPICNKFNSMINSHITIVR